MTHGPTRAKVYKKKINRKMARKALATVLAAKVRDHEVLIVETFTLSQPKTKDAVRVFTSLAEVKPFTGLVAKPRQVVDSGVPR